ncbi:hypothetical protein ABIB94_008110 [Bradyrhizobium sp. JR7.2]
MPTVMVRASNILREYDEARSELIGKAVVRTDGKAGTVEHIWLDELHGLHVSMAGHDERWPAATIKHAESLTSPRLRVAQIACSFQNIPIKMKIPTSVRKVTLMIATVRNTSLAERGSMNASHLAKPGE